jgi:hypothetical protein
MIGQEQTAGLIGETVSLKNAGLRRVRWAAKRRADPPGFPAMPLDLFDHIIRDNK